MKDIQKIKEFFSQPMKESLTGGYPHTKTSGENFEKITITEPIDDATKNKMIKNFRAAGWDAKPNNGGGITAIKKSIMEDNLDEGKGYIINSIKRRLDALGVKYEMSTTDKVRPFKVIYQPINKSDKWYDEFEDIVDLFNLKGVVKSSMSEAKFMSGMLSGKDFINAKLKNYPKAQAKVNQLINMIGESKFTIEMAEWIFDFFNNAHFESPINEAKEEELEVGDTIKINPKAFPNFKFPYGTEGKISDINKADYASDDLIYTVKIRHIDSQEDLSTELYVEKPTQYLNEAKEEDKVDTVTMDVPLFIRMLEYSREDAAQDVDLHDVTEKAISLGKERGILQMDDYAEIVGAAEDAPKNKMDEAELTEAYVPSNIKEFAKRKGVSSLVNKVAGWAEKVGKRITGGTAIGYNYSTLILDMGYQTADIYINTDDETIELYGEEVNSFPEFKRVYLDNKEEDNGLAERIAEALNKINEELCPAGKAYIKRRQAAGEKSSAYLSGRGVKVCKGQMSGKAKKK
jgi:hypothetical protein